MDAPLASVMGFMEEECKKGDSERDDKVYSAALDYLTQRLGPNGLYEAQFSHYKNKKFLPCIRQNLETGEVMKEMQSPSGKRKILAAICLNTSSASLIHT